MAALAAAVLRIHAAPGSVDIPQEFPRGAAPGACRPPVVEPVAAFEAVMDGMGPRVGGHDLLDVVPAPAEWAGGRSIHSGITGVARRARHLPGHVQPAHTPVPLVTVRLSLHGMPHSHIFWVRLRSPGRYRPVGLLCLMHPYRGSYCLNDTYRYQLVSDWKNKNGII